MRFSLLVIAFVLCWTFSGVCVEDVKTYGSMEIAGLYCTLTIDSYDGYYLEPGDLSTPYYAFWQSDGMDYSFEVTDGSKTLDYAYLYFGDGTGQMISSGNAYNHKTEENTDIRPALVVVFTDSTVEEVLAPPAFEIWLANEETLDYSITFSPPMTSSLVVNTALADNGHTPNHGSGFVCICGHLTAYCGKSHGHGSSDCKFSGNCAPEC